MAQPTKGPFDGQDLMDSSGAVRNVGNNLDAVSPGKLGLQGQAGQFANAIAPSQIANFLGQGIDQVHGLVGSLLGGNTQNNFQATAAPIQAGFTQDQINQSYNNSQQGLGQQQAFLQALQAQNGMGNQSNILGQQQALANQLQQNALGNGPNPAQAMLANQTGQNVANQASLMAGQRGASQNVGLMGRQIAQQGAGIQQQGVGQAAAMQAQQQLAAQQQLGQQQAQMQNVAGNQVGAQANALGNYNNAAQNQQQMLLNANSQYNNAMVNQQSGMNSINANVASQNAAGQKGLLGGITGALGGISSMFADGGMVGYDDGGQVSPSGPQSQLGQMLNSNMQLSNQMANAQPQVAQAPMMQQPSSDKKSDSGEGMGSMLGLLALLSDGGPVPGHANVKGNSRSNDTVPAMLSPGEIVIPRSALQGKNPRQSAITFLDAVLAKHKGPRK